MSAQSITLLVIFSVLSVSCDDWQPIPRPRPVSRVTYHGHPSRTTYKQALALERGYQLQSEPNLGSYPSSSKQNSFYDASLMQSAEESCSVYKLSFNQDLFYQYVQYKIDMPSLKEFTLCTWSKFHNHSEDHPLFSYSVGDSKKEITSWISNTEEASYFSFAVHGQTFYRLNYPLKLNKWYHSCQSWNGKTGEWQIWVNNERVGRGFHNRLVGHVIKGGGLAISGQDQALLFGGPQDAAKPQTKQSGMMGEITMLQLYRVALTAGKAHKDHKHHHVHHFRHDGTPVEAPTSPAPPEPETPAPTPIGNGAFLIGGQIMRGQRLNVLGSQMQEVPVQLSNGAQLNRQFINGQFNSAIVSEQLLGSAPSAPDSLTRIPFSPFSDPTSFSSSSGFEQSLLSGPSDPSYSPSSLGPRRTSSVVLSGSLINPANVQYIDDTLTQNHGLFKRSETEKTPDDKENKRDKRDNPEKEVLAEFTEKTDTKRQKKRGLIALSDGAIIDDTLLTKASISVQGTKLDDDVFQQSLIDGLAGFGGNVPVQNIQKEKVDEREPAEAEVSAVNALCSSCSSEPFQKALVLSWQDTPKKLVSGAQYEKGLPICEYF